MEVIYPKDGTGKAGEAGFQMRELGVQGLSVGVYDLGTSCPWRDVASQLQK